MGMTKGDRQGMTKGDASMGKGDSSTGDQQSKGKNNSKSAAMAATIRARLARRPDT